MIDLNEIAVFIRVVDAGSFSGAAKLLGLPRSTVSRKVAQLEESLGIRLLQRSTRKLNLTQAGREYYQQCSNAITNIEKANQQACNLQQSPSGSLRITAPLVAQNGFMCDWINEFIAMFPDVNAEVLLTDDNIDMIERGIDVAFRAGALSDSSLVARRLVETRLVLCASPEYLSKAAPINSLNDIKLQQCILVGDAQSTANWRLQNESQSAVIPLNSKLIVNSMEFALNACLAGIGIGLIPDAMVADFIETGRLKQVLTDYSSEIGGLYVVYPSRENLSITVRTFVDFICEKAANGVQWKHNS